MIDERFPNWEIDVENGTIYSLKYKRYIGSIGKDGYLRVGRKYKYQYLHQIIWVYVNGDILDGYDVHHIDGNKLNNSIYNLELKEGHVHNSEHKIGHHCSEETKLKMSKSQINNLKKSKKVAQYTLNGELVKIWESVAECGRNGFSRSHIIQCCNNKEEKSCGYKWKYLNENRDVA